ncbi:hypothetical protein AN643_03640 [Candidatus Epulonipiscioides saccharophilum]|nr:hypothetical protein AN643_03640 [Epulopiscium sp. SCG-B10WGA-EpuloB]
MKIALLCANIKDDLLFSIKQTITKVFSDLETEVEEINLEILPYFSGSTSVMGDQIFNAIGECNGLVAFSNIHLTGIHGAMQTFLNYSSVYPDVIKNKPMLAITYSNVWGEETAAHLISSAWRFLGGVDVNPLALNSYISPEDILQVTEKQIENYYRMINQGISNIISTERMLFLNRDATANSNGNNGHVKVEESTKKYSYNPSPTALNTNNGFSGQPNFSSNASANEFTSQPNFSANSQSNGFTNQPNFPNFNPQSNGFASQPNFSNSNSIANGFSNPPNSPNSNSQSNGFTSQPIFPNSNSPANGFSSQSNFSSNTPSGNLYPSNSYNTSEENEIKEISNILKGKTSESSFIPAATGTYQKPPGSRISKKIASLPHYFIAQHDKAFEAVVQYSINDTKELGYIVIKNGDCIYVEGSTENYTVEISMLDSVFDELITKALSYQKAFMVGRIKVKGNFAILPKLDQIFRSSREYN